MAAEVHDQSTPIYIVGHSLGAWSGAHLSQRLSEWGYRVEMLVTLDPVGSGLLVRLGSRIPYRPGRRAATAGSTCAQSRGYLHNYLLSTSVH